MTTRISPLTADDLALMRSCAETGSYPRGSAASDILALCDEVDALRAERDRYRTAYELSDHVEAIAELLTEVVEARRERDETHRELRDVYANMTTTLRAECDRLERELREAVAELEALRAEYPR
jgi:uncharacterized coiled-coil DUF342 family protein